MPNFHMPKAPWVSDAPSKRGSKTAQAKKSIVISDVNDKSEKRVVHTSAGEVVFEHGMAHLPNDARGNDIADEYKTIARDPKRGLAIVKDRPTRWKDPIHNYFFTVPELPWHKKEEEDES